MTTAHSTISHLALGASLLGLAALPLQAQATLLQPPISAWSPAQAGANPAPAATDSAPSPAAALPAPAKAAAPVPANLPPAAPARQPVPLPRQNAVQRLLAFQANGVAAGARQPISGAEAIASYKAWLRTFASQQQSSAKPLVSGTTAMTQPLPGNSGTYGN